MAVEGAEDEIDDGGLGPGDGLGLPPMAVPITVKMPEPMTAPMPSAVRETGPRVFLRECSGRSESEMSLSMDLVANICLDRGLVPRHVLDSNDCMREWAGWRGGTSKGNGEQRGLRSPLAEMLKASGWLKCLRPLVG
jgi:hypothetical protein